eukprot:4765139-Prymnesium_polylepis.1
MEEGRPGPWGGVLGRRQLMGRPRLVEEGQPGPWGGGGRAGPWGGCWAVAVAVPPWRRRSRRS